MPFRGCHFQFLGIHAEPRAGLGFRGKKKKLCCNKKREREKNFNTRQTLDNTAAYFIFQVLPPSSLFLSPPSYQLFLYPSLISFCIHNRVSDNKLLQNLMMCFVCHGEKLIINCLFFFLGHSGTMHGVVLFL